MVCALTVRSLRPGTLAQFKEAFLAGEGPPPGFVRFNMLRNRSNPDEVICFGFFDGTVDQLRQAAADFGYEQQLARIAPFVERIGTDGLFEIVEDWTASA
jgi:hypothetical protein